jgi:uncharacterized membrane protein YgcG
VKQARGKQEKDMKLTRLTTNSFPRRIPVLETALAVALIALCGPGFAAKGGDPGPPVGGESPNNLSMPSIQTQSTVTTDAYWIAPAGAELGVHYSYGCDAPESHEQFNYPNTSCVDDLAAPTVYYDVAGCKANVPQCANLDIYRIYWQKVDVNEWWADDEGTTVWPLPVASKFVDWGDALEAVPWNERSVIRVETQPYSSTLSDDPATLGVYEASLLVDDETGVMQTCAEAAAAQGLDPLAACKTGFQMWHVSGQGITEHWGVRASDPQDDSAVSYNYDSPFQIIKSTNARLNLTKLVKEAATCPEPGGNPNDPPPVIDTAWTGSGWTNTCNYDDMPYAVETSVGGKYVYGYNWRMKSVDPSLVEGCAGYEKTGYWRLTFYAPGDITFAAIDDSVLADDDMKNIINKAPPVPAAEERVLVEEAPVFIASAQLDMVASAEAEDEDPDADDRLFRPIIDKTNELTYIDICIKAKATSGGGGNGGKGGGGRGGGVGGGKGSGKGGGK